MALSIISRMNCRFFNSIAEISGQCSEIKDYFQVLTKNSEALFSGMLFIKLKLMEMKYYFMQLIFMDYMHFGIIIKALLGGDVGGI
jgi:hypothetical protein